ncbi:uncharacterized protein IL334_006467 [Kwoniella shivajii]|uniref:Uncharacterized protein n=1 Tax=Kwoniella shivajii TaxID=564305 RepID=A0ABZ1D6L8_9TREE|nr:hypothetical protein IL334_006467 [Kwoniella shivajii]
MLVLPYYPASIKGDQLLPLSPLPLLQPQVSLIHLACPNSSARRYNLPHLVDLFRQWLVDWLDGGKSRAQELALKNLNNELERSHASEAELGREISDLRQAILGDYTSRASLGPTIMREKNTILSMEMTESLAEERIKLLPKQKPKLAELIDEDYSMEGHFMNNLISNDEKSQICSAAQNAVCKRYTKWQNAGYEYAASDDKDPTLLVSACTRSLTKDLNTIDAVCSLDEATSTKWTLEEKK